MGNCESRVTNPVLNARSSSRRWRRAAEGSTREGCNGGAFDRCVIPRTLKPSAWTAGPGAAVGGGQPAGGAAARVLRPGLPPGPLPVRCRTLGWRSLRLGFGTTLNSLASFRRTGQFREGRPSEHAARTSSRTFGSVQPSQPQPPASALDDAPCRILLETSSLLEFIIIVVHLSCRYGNRLHTLPEAALGLPSLRGLWLEANPLEDSGDLRPAAADHHLALGPKLKNVGLDQYQVG